MGYCIDPVGMTKEQFLCENGKQIPREEFLKYWSTSDRSVIPVSWINNGAFTAAGVAYSKNEAEVFANLNDGRPVRFFFADKSKVDRFCPDLRSMLNTYFK